MGMVNLDNGEEYTDKDILEQIDIPDEYIDMDLSMLYGEGLEDYLIHELGLKNND